MNKYYRNDALLANIGMAIRRRRHELNMSQEDLAFSIGSNQSHIARIECGKVNTSISHLTAIARELKTTLSNLLAEL